MKKNLLILVFGIFCAVMISSCDKRRGCTDPTSDNYDSEAVEDDDTCIPTRFKFVGDYESYGTIEDEPGILISYDQIGLNIEDSTVTNAQEFIIGISNFDVPVNTLDGVVTGTYTFNVKRQQIGVYTYWGTGNINGRVLEMKVTRTEEVTLPDMSTGLDTILLSLYGLKELE